MRIVFRVDASLSIGSGHVMRCLTLGSMLREAGAECRFLCREAPAHLNREIADQGFVVHTLSEHAGGATTRHCGQEDSPTTDPDSQGPSHADWLGTTQAVDALQTLEVLRELAPDWLVVDHYALDARWEASIREWMPEMGLMVIDDLADRPHRADILLDQNAGRSERDYRNAVPDHCRCLVGPRYALLRPEFAEWRTWSLQRRTRAGEVRQLLVSLGGVDNENRTGQVLAALSEIDLPEDLEITVVMGAYAPWLEDVRCRAQRMPCKTEVVVNVNDMARRMAEADLAIGAAGSTAWERCCVGLPSIVLVLAENQQAIAQALQAEGAAHVLWGPDAMVDLVNQWEENTERKRLDQMSRKAADLVDGCGGHRVRTILMEREEMNEGTDG